MDYVPEKQAVYIRLTMDELNCLIATIEPLRYRVEPPLLHLITELLEAASEDHIATLLDLRERLDALRLALTRDTGVWP